MRVLMTGATGYVGGRLVPRLLERGHRVRALARDPRRLRDRPWVDEVEVVEGDLTRPETLAEVVEGMDSAYYLVHSMCSGDDFAERDRRAARAFVDAGSSLKRVVYLGGLQPDATPEGIPTEHLASRAEVGLILRDGLPTAEIRAGPVIGSGSASFEMVRYLTERLPVMVTPKWVLNPVQPVAVDDVLRYLTLALEHREAEGVVEVGADALSFKEMMEVYARVRDLHRWVVPVPVLAPALAARWVGLVTPIPNCLAVPLVKGVVRPVLADRARARELFPEVRPVSYRTAVEQALARTREDRVTTRWSGALGNASHYELEDREGVIHEVRSLAVDAPPEAVFRAVTSLGGDRGWLVWDRAWRLRGVLDKLVGGPGLRRGRRHPDEIAVGEALDFWRVEEVREPELLRLRAEMKVPGRAWLEWEIFPDDEGSRLVQTALFAPRGLPGVLYWYLLYPAHRLIFKGLVRALAREAENADPPWSGVAPRGPAPSAEEAVPPGGAIRASASPRRPRRGDPPREA